MIKTSERPVHNHLQILAQYDPTHTTGLRNQFAGEMGKRFKALRGDIRHAVEVDDCFGLKKQSPQIYRQSLKTYGVGPGRHAFDFSRDSQKVDAFLEWVHERAELRILETPPGTPTRQAIENSWTNKYVDSAYQSGIRKGRAELRKAGYTTARGEPVPKLDDTGGIRAALNEPIHADRIGVCYSRCFREMKGITEQMDTQLSRVLSQGLAEGRGTRHTARLLNRTISGPSGDLGITDSLGRYIPAERRARMLSRTETIRAHNHATIQEYRTWKAHGVTVMAEVRVAGDARMCPECEAYANEELSLDEAERLFPLHPNCRCSFVPAPVKRKNQRKQ